MSDEYTLLMVVIAIVIIVVILLVFLHKTPREICILRCEAMCGGCDQLCKCTGNET